MVNGMRTGRRSLSGLGLLGFALAVLVAPAAAADPVDSAEPESQVVVDVSPPPAAAAVSTAPADGVPHLPSPDNLPPGTTQDVPEGPKMSYLRYLWQAVQTPGVTMGDALMLIAQRPMDAKSAPPSSTTGPVAPAVEPVILAPASP